MTSADTPLVTRMRVIPVAGLDSMLLNLSGAHRPFFTRNVVLLKDNASHIGMGEVPGGEEIRAALEAWRQLVVGCKIGDRDQGAGSGRSAFWQPGQSGPRLQTFD